MRSVDAINGEIGQLRGQIRKHEARIHDLEIERAEVEMTALGLTVGTHVEYSRGNFSRGVIVGFCCDCGSGVRVKTTKKNGDFGVERKVPGVFIRNVKIVRGEEDASCAS